MHIYMSIINKNICTPIPCRIIQTQALYPCCPPLCSLINVLLGISPELDRSLTSLLNISLSFSHYLSLPLSLCTHWQGTPRHHGVSLSRGPPPGRLGRRSCPSPSTCPPASGREGRRSRAVAPRLLQ